MIVSVRMLAWIVVWFALGCQFEHGEKGLNGRTFWLESAVGFSAMPGFAPPTLQFGSRHLVYSAGCVPHEVQYSLENGRLMVVYLLDAPPRNCDVPQLEAQEGWLSDFIALRPRIVVEGARLTLTSDNPPGDEVQLTFVDSEVASPGPTLAKTLWTIDTLVTDEGQINVSVDTPATIVFDDEAGRVHVDTTCVVGEGIYATEDDSLILVEVLYPTIPCDGEVATLNAHMQEVMSNGVLTFEIVADRLTLMHSRLGIGAHIQ